MRLIRNKKVRIVFLVLCLLGIIGLSQSLYAVWSKKDIVEDRRKALSLVEEENKRLKDEYARVQAPEYIEKQAREKLGFIKQGEVVVLVDTPLGPSEQSEQKPQEVVPTWKQWLRLFF